MARAAARLKASGMAITGTAAGRRKDRGLEAHKITALTSAWGPIGQNPLMGLNYDATATAVPYK